MTLIETDRLYIKYFSEEYLPEFMDYRNDLEQMKFQDFKNQTLEEYKKALLGKKDFNDGLQLAVIYKDSNKLIGDLYLKKSDRVLCLGYAINKAYYRKGYAFEACCGIINCASNFLISSIEASVDLKNIPSVNLLKKLGFIYVSTNNNVSLYKLRLK